MSLGFSLYSELLILDRSPWYTCVVLRSAKSPVRSRFLALLGPDRGPNRPPYPGVQRPDRDRKKPQKTGPNQLNQS